MTNNNGLTLTSLLVGMHFRPPAKTLLASLPAGAKLALRPEPENPYDENAVAVYVSPAEFPASQLPILESALPNNGFTLEDVQRQPEWQLGYVAATGNKPLLKAGLVTGNLEFLPIVRQWCAANGTCVATLGFDATGNPLVILGDGIEADEGEAADEIEHDVSFGNEPGEDGGKTDNFELED